MNWYGRIHLIGIWKAQGDNSTICTGNHDVHGPSIERYFFPYKICHRYNKPENVFVKSTNECNIGDFGKPTTKQT